MAGVTDLIFRRICKEVGEGRPCSGAGGGGWVLDVKSSNIPVFVAL